ncbi:hypothetical protein HDK64DRAFT_14191 [Phyllosticta capitalensis]
MPRRVCLSTRTTGGKKHCESPCTVHLDQSRGSSSCIGLRLGAKHAKHEALLCGACLHSLPLLLLRTRSTTWLAAADLTTSSHCTVLLHSKVTRGSPPLHHQHQDLHRSMIVNHENLPSPRDGPTAADETTRTRTPDGPHEHLCHPSSTSCPSSSHRVRPILPHVNASLRLHTPTNHSQHTDSQPSSANQPPAAKETKRHRRGKRNHFNKDKRQSAPLPSPTPTCPAP